MKTDFNLEMKGWVMNFCDWFDIHNKEHLVAYYHLSRTGNWPKNFIPNNIHFEANWHFIILSRMADEYLNIILSSL